MEIVAGVVVTTVCLAAGFVTLRGAGAAAHVMTEMFKSPADLGWPSGVQEDDDFHWAWTDGTAPFADVGPGVGGDTCHPPEIVDLHDGSGPRPSPVARH